MTRLVFIFAALLLVAQTTESKTRYCTTKNWSTATDYYRKYESRFIDALDDHDALRKETDSWVFVVKQYKLADFAKLWGEDDPDLKQSLKSLESSARDQWDKVNVQINEMKFLQSKFGTSQDLWIKIADYCYDETGYENYQKANNNKEDALERLGQVKQEMEALQQMKALYEAEIRFILDSRKLYKKS